ncbi:hypothetical protein ACLB2K_065322 [Fragaria x ananassa]
MATRKVLWNFPNKLFTVGVVGLCISDSVASVARVRGSSMSPTLNPAKNNLISTDDYVLLAGAEWHPQLYFVGWPAPVSFKSWLRPCLLEKLCLNQYKFKHGDIVVFCSPSNHKERHIKRITGLPGDWIGNRKSYDVVKVPEGHCWVEGDNSSSSMDSRTFGTIPLGLIQGKVTHIVWPPQRIGCLKLASVMLNVLSSTQIKSSLFVVEALGSLYHIVFREKLEGRKR